MKREKKKTAEGKKHTGGQRKIWVGSQERSTKGIGGVGHPSRQSREKTRNWGWERGKEGEETEKILGEHLWVNQLKAEDSEGYLDPEEKARDKSPCAKHGHEK